MTPIPLICVMHEDCSTWYVNFVKEYHLDLKPPFFGEESTPGEMIILVYVVLSMS
jgi:hypothetical protein